MREQLATTISNRLTAEKDRLRAEFHDRSRVPTRHFIVDDLLPVEIAQQIFQAFPDHHSFRRMKSFREAKWTSKNLAPLPPILSDITFAVQDERVIRVVEEITGIRNQLADPHLYAGGLSMMVKGDFLNPHIDNSHDKDRANYRTLNLLYYVTPEWDTKSGGNFELWDERVRKPLEIVSKFNRLVVMETNTKSWHSVNRVRVDRPRCCVSNYYFSPDPPDGVPHFHITAFNARPEQPVRRLISTVDAALRSAVRRVVRKGVGRNDIYDGRR